MNKNTTNMIASDDDVRKQIVELVLGEQVNLKSEEEAEFKAAFAKMLEDFTEREITHVLDVVSGKEKEDEIFRILIRSMRHPIRTKHLRELMHFGSNKNIGNLAQGVFWIVDLEGVWNNEKYCFPIYCDSGGTIIENTPYELNAKSGMTYNHELLWAQLPKEDTLGEPFDYYPRGRVQIANKKATVYLNPNINTEEIQQFIVAVFNLHESNGLNKVTFISDGTNHYKCHLDY